MKLRPQIKDNDSALAKIIKYIPAEIITVYTAIIGILKQNLDVEAPKESDINIYFIVLIIITVITPIWTYYAVIDNKNISEPPSKKKRARFHSIIAMIAFLIWVYATGDVLFRAWLCDFFSTYTPSSFDECDLYNSMVGSVVLFLFTFLIVPLAERIILGKPTKNKSDKD